MTTEPSGERSPVTLAELIHRHRDATGDSLQKLADASGLSKPKIYQLSQADSIYTPRAETVQKLARGLRLPLPVVQEAAIATMGLHPGGERVYSQRVDVLAARLAELTDDDLTTVEGLVHSIQRRRG